MMTMMMVMMMMIIIIIAVVREIADSKFSSVNVIFPRTANIIIIIILNLFSSISFQATAFWSVQIATRHQSDLPQHPKHVRKIIYACLAVDL